MDNLQTTYSAVFGAIVASKRKIQEKEQSEIANVLGISQASYSRLESGKSSMSTDQIFLVAQALGETVSNLMSEAESYITRLENKGYNVTPQLRGIDNSGAGKVIAGAALGALFISLLSNR